MSMNKWTRAEIIALVAAIIAIIGIITALFHTEFRHMIGVEPSPARVETKSNASNPTDGGATGDNGSVGDNGMPTENSKVEKRERTVTIPANVRWMDTGINVQKGTKLYIAASGTVTWGAPGITDGTNVVGPNGTRPPYREDSNYYDFPIPEAGIGSLVMRISGVKYAVGSTATVYVKETGNIEFMVNDDIIRDNSGSFTVNIKL
jgi:hypothetical protein